MIDIITSIIKRINVVFSLLIFGCQQPNQTQKIIMNNICLNTELLFNHLKLPRLSKNIVHHPMNSWDHLIPVVDS